MTKLLLATAAETAAGRLPQAEIAFLLLPLLLVVIFAVLYRREKRRRRQLEYLLGQTKNRCFVCDRNARILDCRPGALAGKSASKVAGLLADAPDREEIGETIREVFRTGIPQSRHAANGEFQTFRKVPSGVFGAEAVLVLSADESEKRELETEVRFLTVQRSAATGEMECGVLLVGCDGEILHANPAAGELTGFTARRLAGLHYAKVFPEGEPSAPSSSKPCGRTGRWSCLPAAFSPPATASGARSRAGLRRCRIRTESGPAPC